MPSERLPLKDKITLMNVKCVIPGHQCLSIEVKNYTDDKVLEDVILLLSDKVNEVNFCQSMQPHCSRIFMSSFLLINRWKSFHAF
jgi:hypothetical protein